MGIGHPLINALIDYYQSEAVSGDVLISKNNEVPELFSARYLYKLDFKDGTKKELYKEFVLSGCQKKNDIELLTQSGWEEIHSSPINGSKEQLPTHLRHYEAQLRSEYEGVMSIRSKCVGLMLLHG